MADQGADLSVNTAFRREVADRFGVLPNFFCSADAAPGLIEELGNLPGPPISIARCPPCSRNACSFTSRDSAVFATASSGTLAL